MYKIIIADDEPIIRNSLKKLIEKTDLPVSVLYSVSNGEDVLKCLAETQCDIAFIDINMPKINGLFVLKRLKKLDRQLYTIVISGYDNFSYAQKAIEFGVKKYILKPFSFDDIKLTLQDAISELEKFKNKYTISILDVETIISDIVNLILERNLRYKDVVQSAANIISNLDPNIANKFSYELTELIYNRLNFNMGFNFTYHITKNSSENIKKIIENFNANIDAIYSIIGQAYQNIQDNVISQAISILDKGIDFNITLEQIADSFGYNSLYFGRLFKKITGDSFIQYKTKQCIKKAAFLLLNTDMTITEISQKLNFNDSAYFTTIFKKHTMLSPKEYRKQRGKSEKND